MAIRNADCAFERTLRAKPFERPQTLRRGQGVGGGNYRKIASTTGDGRTVQGRSSVSRSTSVNQGGPYCNSRPNSASPSNSRPATASSVASSSSCPQNIAQSSKSRQTRQQKPPDPTPGGSKTGQCQRPSSDKGGPRQTRPPIIRPSSAGATTGVKNTPESSAKRDNRITASCPPSKSRLSASYPDNATRTELNTQSRNRYQTSSSSVRPRVNDRPANNQTRLSTTVPSNKPGPSCLKPSQPSDGNKRRVQFSGVPPPRSQDTNSNYNVSSTIKVRSNGVKRKAESSSCEPNAGVTPRGPNQNQTYGPSLYPIYPDQYETPYVSMPGPRQVLLMPGDINPNETTIIDIVGLDEGDIVDVPGIPPQAPANLLEDTWNEFIREAEQGVKRQRASRVIDSKRITSIGVRGKKKNEQQLRNKTNLNLIKQGRAFSFEEYGNLRVEDPNNQVYEGPSYRAPDPECQRARPFTYNSRKTSVRPFTDDERREIEEAQTYRAIKAIINEYDARWESDRAARGLSEDDLLDIDTDDWTPREMPQAAPRDIFQATDNCGFGEPFFQTPQLELSPVPGRSQPQYSQYQDLIGWEEDVPMPASNCDDIDLITRTPPNSSNNRRLSGSPNLMSMWEPEVDLIGLNSPPRPKTPSPSPKCERDDLIRWNASPRRSLPFDPPGEETFFDTVTRPSPPSTRMRTPPVNSNLPRASGRKGISTLPSQRPEYGGCPPKEPRIVRAIPMENDPNIVVLESSPLASKRQSPERCESTIDDADENDSLRILDLDNFCDEQLNNLIDDFDAPRLAAERPKVFSNISGIIPLVDDEECEDDDDDLGILDEDCLPDFEFSTEADTRLNEERYQELCQQLAEDVDMLEQEQCPFGPEFEEFDRQYQEERADLLNLCHDPDVSPVQRQNMGRFGSELVQQCQDPIEQCADLLGILGPPASSPQKRMGPFTRELLENCPDEQQMIDLDDDCPPEQSTCPTNFNYSRDLFTNVQWDPSMAPKTQSNRDNECPR